MSKKKEIQKEDNILLVEDKSQYYTWILISIVLFVILIIGVFIVNSYAIFDGISKKELDKYYVKRDTMNFNDLSYDIRKEYIKADSIETFNKKSVIILKEENTKLKKELDLAKSKIDINKPSVNECKNNLEDIESFNVDLQKEIVLLQNQLKSLEPFKNSKVIKKETFDKMKEKYDISIQEIEIANLSLQKELVALQKKLKNLKENYPTNPFEKPIKEEIKTVQKENQEPKVIVKEVIKIVQVPTEKRENTLDNGIKISKPKSNKRLKQVSCQDMKPYEHQASNTCKATILELTKKYDKTHIFEIIPTVNKEDREFAKNYKAKSKDYLMRGLAKQRVNEARNLLINNLGKDINIKRVGYYLKTNFEKGFIIRVYK
jgi:hypothetical protein